MKSIYRAKIEELQVELKKSNIDYCILADADPHNSEYVGDVFKKRSFYSGFTGSNGQLLVGQEGAWLWTDGRYFIQAQNELEGSGIQLMRMGEKDVPTLNGFLSATNKSELVIGIDARCFMHQAVLQMKEVLEKAGKKCIIKSMSDTTINATGEKIRVLPEYLRGAACRERVSAIRHNLRRRKADAYLSCKLDTNMWLMNIRGEDILYNPVAFSYVLVKEESVTLFVKETAVTAELEAYICQIPREKGKTDKSEDCGDVFGTVSIENYDDAALLLAGYLKRCKLVTDMAYLNEELYETLNEAEVQFLEGDCDTALMQAIKTPVEKERIKEIYLKDSAAVCKFLYWLSKQEPGSVSEYDAMCKMDSLRAQIPENRGLSFHTISAFGANAAMMHYETKEESCAVLNSGNLFLLDSGGQYDGGTTDVTRTVIIGEPTEEMRKHFTMVVRGMLALQNAYFMKGCTGMNLDILARAPMWEENMDYKCGTGHGIGYMLNVHEGPQAIRVKSVGVAGKTEFAPGMLVSDEPGIYLEGQYGIRMENILLCEFAAENADGIFYHFYPLTYVPIDMRLVALEQMQPKEIKWLEEYQKAVLQKVLPYLDENEAAWLKSEIQFFEGK